MKYLAIVYLMVLLMSCTTIRKESGNDGWIPLFDGTTLNGWKASENPSTFSVKDALIVVHGPRG